MRRLGVTRPQNWHRAVNTLTLVTGFVRIELCHT
jgi:hypothetical protein